MRIKKIATILTIVILTSCKSSNQVTYFQNLDSEISAQQKERNINYEAKIIPDDQLSISVSNIDPLAVSVFNNPTKYLVNSKGYIDYPILGSLRVAGMTRSELIELLKDKISAYAKSPLVSVQILNFKISVLGEVNRPGTITVPSERISILDAIGMAGDLTLYGERTNVLLIRDNGEKQEYHYFDLTSSKMMASPFFYLQQNDIVYVEPNKARRGNAKYSQSAQFNMSVASTIIGAVSVIASLTIALLVK